MGGMQIAEDYQAFNLGIGKDLGLFGAFSFDITQANTTLADGPVTVGNRLNPSTANPSTRQEPISRSQDIAILRKVFITLSDSAYSRMSGYTVNLLEHANEQTQFIDLFNLFYSKRGQEQISISQQLGNYGTTFSVPVAKVTGTRHAATSKSFIWIKCAVW